MEKDAFRGKISKVHFIYICIIFVIVLLSILSMTISDNKSAASKLDFAGMLVSAVLAVVAILYTLWQGEASRRDNSQLSSSIGHLEVLLSHQSMDLQNFTEDLKALRDISLKLDSITNAIKNAEEIRAQVEEMRDEILRSPKETPGVQSGGPDPKQDKLAYLSEKMSKILGNSNLHNSRFVESTWRITLSYPEGTKPSGADLVNVKSRLERAFFDSLPAIDPDNSTNLGMIAVFPVVFDESTRELVFDVKFGYTRDLPIEDVRVVLEKCIWPGSISLSSFYRI